MWTSSAIRVLEVATVASFHGLTGVSSRVLTTEKRSSLSRNCSYLHDCTDIAARVLGINRN